MAISGDGKLVVFEERDGTVLVWADVEAMWDSSQCLIGQIDRISYVTIGKDGKLVKSGSRDKAVTMLVHLNGK